MGLTQAEFGERVGLTGNSVARIERGAMIVTKSIALLVGYVAREAGVETAANTRSGRRSVAPKKAGGAGAGHSTGKGGPKKGAVPRR
jgi:hypothetical protein